MLNEQMEIGQNFSHFQMKLMRCCITYIATVQYAKWYVVSFPCSGRTRIIDKIIANKSRRASIALTRCVLCKHIALLPSFSFDRTKQCSLLVYRGTRARRLYNGFIIMQPRWGEYEKVDTNLLVSLHSWQSPSQMPGRSFFFSFTFIEMNLKPQCEKFALGRMGSWSPPD